MEHDVCFFDAGNDVAGQDRSSDTGSAAVCAAAVRIAGDYSASPVVSGSYRSGGRYFPYAGGACGAFLGGDANACSAGDDLVSKV